MRGSSCRDTRIRARTWIALEREQHVDETIAAYKSALEVVTEDVGAMQAQARAQVWHERTDDGTGRLLREIAFRGESEEWRRLAAALVAGRERGVRRILVKQRHDSAIGRVSNR